jgi:V8-like Glu-specific endopeptidase
MIMNVIKYFQLTLTISAIFISNRTFSQISIGGIPPSFSNYSLSDFVATRTMPIVDLTSTIEEDSEDKPFRFGYAIDVDINLKNAGTLNVLSNGDKLWRLKIHSAGAFSINLIYDQFWLPEGSQFFVYNETGDMILGAFTSNVSNNEYNQFATDLVKGNTIILEYYEPNSVNNGIIHISKVIHGYVDTFSGGLGTSADCNIDVNCHPQGNDWSIEKRAVSMILVDNNTAFCTGCLVNNIRNDLTPYYLTANHCLDGNTNTWIFRFRYWRPSCNGDNPDGWKSIMGATLKAHHAATDFALLKLNTSIPSDFDVSYAGWDRTTLPATNATTIHHPKGDAMKISHDFDALISVPWNLGVSNHWRAVFDQGIVQHGSSGAPLFNQNHKIIGQLHGNQNNYCSKYDNTCHCQQTPIGEYGRFDISWNGGGASASRLKDWLDPDNTNPANLIGLYPCNTIYINNQTYNSGTATVIGCNIFIANITINSNATVRINSTEGVTIGPDFWAKEGSNVTITAAQASPNLLSAKAQDDDDMLTSLESAVISPSTGDIDFTVYPNPNDGNFTVEIAGEPQPYTVEIFNASGGMLGKVDCDAQAVNIDRSDLPAGVYYLKLGMSGKQAVKKLIVR